MKCENEYEKIAWNHHELIIGIDEAGRGPLCGPCVVAGVIFPEGYDSDEIYDSKKLTEKKRDQLFDVIKKEALYYSIEIVTPETIDKYNIYRATQLAMEKIAVSSDLNQYVVTDAMPLPEVTDRIIDHPVKGDQKSVSVAAASILAKVTRDRIMVEYDAKYPQYGLKKHKGYPTKEHLAAIEKYGVIEGFYRFSYGPVAKAARQLKFDI